ncbi:DivIVA domain-containing protein [Clostridiaceae bacterium M8S5]|nr:DivIVA domain-containing protein [Clostridiaceae bacterium M8S5]
MLTPLDIQKKEFSMAFRGYKVSQVESFLDQIITDFENIINDNIELKDRIETLDKRIEHYQTIEDTLQNTLVVAQKTAEDVNLNAKQKHDTIVKEAKEKARKIIEDANNDVIEMQRKYDNMRKEALMFKAKFRSLLASQIEATDTYYNLNDMDVETTSLK